MWQIKYQDEFFKIVPGQNPEMQRNSPLFLLDNILIEKSTPFNVQYSDEMSPKLQHLFFELTKKEKVEVEVELYTNESYRCNATMVIEAADMDQRNPSDSTVSGYLKTGISSFFAKIKDKLLTELDLGGTRTIPFTTDDPADASAGFWQEFQETWDYTNDYVVVPFKNLAFASDDLQFQFTDGWANKLDLNNKLDPRQPVVPWVKLEYVLNAIFKDTGWKLDTTGLNDEDWKKLLLFSNMLIDTNYYSESGSYLNRSEVNFDLANAMPAEITCSRFFLEICKKYFWFPSANVNQHTVKLIALKETGKKVPKDWTRYAKGKSRSDFAKDPKIFGFTNTFEGEDQYPSDPDLAAYPLKGFSYAAASLPNPNTAGDYSNVIYFCYLENRFFKTEWNGLEIEWVPFTENIYDENPADATDTYDTAVTTLPIVKAMLASGFFAFIPVCNQEKLTKWGMRTLLYHGMVRQINGSGAPISLLYPYASCTHQPPSNVNAKLTWANVLKYSDFTNEYGIIKYWASRWLKMIASTQTITRFLFLPLHELILYTWDDIILINNLAYFIESYNEPLDYQGFIQANLIPITPVTEAVVDPPDEDEDVHFTTQEELTVDAYSQSKLQLLKGPAGATVNIEVIEFDTTDPQWYFKINEVNRYVGNTFNIVLDGSGNGYFTAKIGRGTSGFITGNLAKVQITVTSIGAIGSPDIAQYNKVII